MVPVKLNKLAQIELVMLDIDGVLTDGLKYYTANGLASLTFHAHDGLGIHLLLQAGYRVALITNDRNDIIKARVADLGVPYLLEGIEDKGVAVQDLRREMGIDREKALYMGDNLWGPKSI